jgi:type II secretory ATPase GspE/PulE/Tfp pilus assembly ATPase PilB-like protein
MKIEAYLIASTVNLVIGQRLVRKICSNCKVEKKLTTAEYDSMIELATDDLIKKTSKFFKGVGCDKCNQTGYKGRIGVYEVMVIDSIIREAILRKAQASEIRQLAIQHGMVSLLADGLEKAKQGQTTIEEVFRMLYD